MAVSYVSGYTSDEYINFCPNCGEKITLWTGDGNGKCYVCGFEFYVIDSEFKVKEVK